MRRRAAAIVLGLGALACRGRDHLVLESRLLAEEPTAVLRHEELVEAERVVEWGRASCLTSDGWEVAVSEAERSCAGAVLLLTPAQRYVTLTRQVDLAAVGVDAFELEIDGMPRQQVGVEWIHDGEAYGPSRRVEGSVRVDPEGGRGRVRLPVRGRPGWEGTVTGVRITLVVPARGTVRIASIAALDERVDARRLADVAKRGWRFDLANEVRGGLLGLPGAPIRWRVGLAKGSELRLAYGLLGACERSVNFAVDVVSQRGARERLAAHDLSCGDAAGWRQMSVRIADGHAGPATLELHARPEGDLDPALGVPLWGAPELLAPGPEEGLNLVLVSIDTLRPDHLSLYGHARPTSPKLDARSQRGGVIFERAIAAAPWTLPSHASLFSGLDAIRHGVNHNRGVPPSLRMLAEVLRDAGLATRAVTGGGFVHQQYGFAQGFDGYASFSERMGFEDELAAGIDRAKAILAAHQDRRFFLFFHTYAVHNPFRPRQPHYQRLTGSNDTALVDVDVLPPQPDDGFRARRALMLLRDGERAEAPTEEVHRLAASLYDSNVAYADEKLGELFATLDELALTGRTLVVVTSDHGELFGEHGEVNHISLYDENVRVPLVLLDPRLDGSRRVQTQVRSVDIMPTVLELLGVAVPDGLDGRSLVPLMAGEGGGAAPGPAWSYASASNFGVALRPADGSSYIARNDAWAPGGHREEGSRAGAPLDLESAARLREAAEEKLRRDLSGVRIRVRNAAAVPASLAIWGRDVQPTRLKLDTLGAGVLRPSEAGPVQLVLESGGEVTLVVEGRHVAPFHLRLDVPGAGSHQFEVDPADLGSAPRWYGLDAGSGGPHARAPGDATGAHVWWQGERDAETEQPVSDEVRRQLEALGYLR